MCTARGNTAARLRFADGWLPRLSNNAKEIICLFIWSSVGTKSEMTREQLIVLYPENAIQTRDRSEEGYLIVAHLEIYIQSRNKFA